jgi:hypothetical protein
MMRIFAIAFLLLGNLVFGTQNSAFAEARQCAVVKNEAKKIFEGKYKEDDGVLAELATRTVKAYTLIIKNKNCLTNKEYKELLTGIKELKKGCSDAKKDEFAWSLMKDLCKIYTPLFKYAR